MASGDVTAASDTRLRGEASSSNGRLEAGRGVGARVALEVLIVVNAVAFLAASIVHFGIAIPLGITTLADVPLLPAAIVEGAIGVAFVLAAFAAFGRRDWAWSGTLGAHLFGVLGVLVGLSITARDPDALSSPNFWFHVIILPVLVAGLLLLLTRSGKAGLGRRMPPEARP